MTKNAQPRLSYIGRKTNHDFAWSLETKAHIQGFTAKALFMNGSAQDSKEWVDRRKLYYEASNISVRHVGPAPIANRLRRGPPLPESFRALGSPSRSHLPGILRLVLAEPEITTPQVIKQRNTGKFAINLPVKASYDVQDSQTEYDIWTERREICSAMGVEPDGEPALHVGSLYFPEGYNADEAYTTALRIGRLFRSIANDTQVTQVGRFNLQ